MLGLRRTGAAFNSHSVKPVIEFDDEQQDCRYHDTRTSLSELVSLALGGNEVFIADDDKPLARLVPISEPKQLCIPGLNRGEMRISQHSLSMARAPGYAWR